MGSEISIRPDGLGGEVRQKIGKSQSERRLLDLAWDAAHPGGADQEAFDGIVAGLRALPLRDHQAARIASLAYGGEILVSRTALDSGISKYPTSEAKMMSLKGISEPIEVSRIDWH